MTDSREPKASPADAAESNDAGRDSLLKSSGVTGSMTMVSRVLGLVRDIVIARVFGTSDAADAFFLANKIPNFMRRLFAEGAFNQAFVPVLSEYRSQRGLNEVRDLVSSVAAALGGFLFLVTVVVVIGAPLFAVPIAYGFLDEPQKFELLVHMLRITFPYLLLISMTALCGSVLNSYGKFAIPAFTPSILNISLISCSFFLAPYMVVPELALAWAVLIAGFAQLLWQMPFLARMRLLPMPRYKNNHEGVQRVLKLMLPAMFGASVTQINLLLDTFIASLLVSGSITWLYFSDRLMELPLGTFGIAIAIVVLPSLSRKHASDDEEEFRATLDWAFKLVFLIAVPASAALIILAEPLLVTLFQNDRFSAFDVQQSAASLRAYSIGLLGFMAIKIFAPGFYARQNTRTPVRIGIIAMVANMMMNIGFYVSGMAHVGLALATSLSAFLNAGLLLFALLRDRVIRIERDWAVFLFRALIANGMMGLFLWRMTEDWQLWLDWSVIERVLNIAMLVIGGVLVYGVSLLIAGIRWQDINR